jgi:PST family polysaccharide transporter
MNALGSRLISTVVFMVLARLLVPADFGLVALSLVFIEFARLLEDQGCGAAIVQRQDVTKGHLDTAFWMSVAAGVCLSGLLVALAGPIASLVGSPDLAPVLMALSLVVLIGAPSSTAIAVLRRGFGFRRLAFRKIVSAIVGGVAGVAAALLGAGVWSLVTQALVQTVVGTALLWTVTPFRPGLSVSRAHFRELFSFGNKFMGIAVLSFISKRSDDLLIGSVLGPTALGLYSVAYRLLVIMTEVMTLTVQSVAFPTFSRMQAERERLRRAYQTAMGMTVAVAAPAFMCVVVLAPDIVMACFGPRWHAAGPVMQVLSMAGLAQSVAASNNTLLLAVGKARTALQLNATYAVVNVVGFLIAVQFGILAVALAFTIRAYLMTPLSIRPVIQYVGLSATRWVGPLVAPVLLGAVTAGTLQLLLTYALGEAGSWLRLAICIPAGCLLYAVLFRLCRPARAKEMLSLVKAALPRKRPVPAAAAMPLTNRDSIVTSGRDA